MGFLRWLKDLIDPKPTPNYSYSPQEESHQPTKPAEPYQIDDNALPAYTAAPAEHAGYRIQLENPVFPVQTVTGPPPFFDTDGVSPVFFGSAHFPDGSIHPCKVASALSDPCRVPYGGGEHYHKGQYTLLPFNPDSMELVTTSHGRIPNGKRPVVGGHEKTGTKLYHAVATIRGVRVPGKTAPELGACNAAWGDVEHVIRINYEILCWKEPPIADQEKKRF